MVITSLTISGVRRVVELLFSVERKLIMAALRFTFTLRLYAPPSPSVPTGADGDGEVSSHFIVGTVELMLVEFIISLYGASLATFWLRLSLKPLALKPKFITISTITRYTKARYHCSGKLVSNGT